MVTASAAFQIVDKASDPIKKIGTNATDSQAKLTGMGKSLDDLDSPKITNSLKTTKNNIQDIGKVTDVAGKTVSSNTSKMGRDFEKMSAKGTASVKRLTEAIRRFEHERATAVLDVDIAKAEAKIRILKHELRTVSTSQARTELENMGLVANTLANTLDGGGGGGGPGGGLSAAAGAGGKGLRASIGGVTGGIGLMAIAMVAAAPAVVAITGAVSALVGSLALAVGGAGVLGVGALGAFVVGVGAIVAVAKPAMNSIKEVKKSQDAYNKAVQTYGDKSSQAVKAHKALEAEFKKNAGVKELLNNTKVLSSRWKNLTGGARQDFIGILNEGLKTANGLLPTFARIADRVLSSTRNAVADLGQMFRGREWKGIFTTLGDTFSKSIGPLSRGLGLLATFFGRVAKAASPLVISMFESFEKWTGGLARSASDQNRVQRVIGEMVGQLKSWIHFFSSAIKLAAAFFGSGAQQGQGMLDGITAQLDKWTTWIQDNPEKMHDFFDRTITSAGKLATALGEIAKTLGEIADGLIPILNAFSDITSLAGGTGLLGPLALVGAAKFSGVGKLFGRGGAGAAGGAAAARGGATAAAGGGAAALGIKALGSNALAEYGILRAYGGSGAVGALGGVGRFAAAGRAGAGLAKGLGGIALRGAGKIALPLTAALAAFDFATKQGTIGERTQHAVHGLTFGLVHDSQTRVENRARGNDAAKALLERTNGSASAIRSRVGSLQASLNASASTAVQTRNGTYLRVHPALEGDARERVQAQLNALKPVLRVQTKIAGQNAANKSSLGISQAYDTRRASGMNAAGVDNALMHDVSSEFRKLGKDGDIQLRKNTAQWTATLEHGTKAQQKTAERLKEYIKHQYAEMGQHVEIVNGQILRGTTTEWKGIADSMTGPAERAAEEVSKAFTAIQQQAVGSLMAMGYDRGQASSIVQGIENGSSVAKLDAAMGPSGAGQRPSTASHNLARSHGFSNGGKKARGGRIGGIGQVDSIAMGNSKVAPGELIVNQHTERKIDNRLGFPGAMDMLVRGEHTPHSLNTYARGGRFGGVSGGLGTLIGKLDNMGFHHGSTTGGKHAANSFHYRGMAVDYGNANNDMAKLWNVVWPMRKQFPELFGPSFLSTHGRPTLMHYGKGFTDPGLQAQHNDHIHIALSGGAGALGGLGAVGGGGGTVRLHGRRSRLGGVPGALSNRATAMMAGALEQRINQSIGGGGSDLTAGVHGDNQAMARQMAARMFGGGQWGALKNLWTQESGFNETATNPTSGAYGIPQALPRGKMGPAAQGSGAAAARAQIAWGLRYIKGRYGDPSGAWAHEKAHNWYSYGGRTPEWGGWHGRGGEFTAHKPTLIGVGESGSERVSIRPQAASNDSGMHFTVSIGKIVNHEEGDIEKILEREFRKVAKSLLHGGEDEL